MIQNRDQRIEALKDRQKYPIQVTDGNMPPEPVQRVPKGSIDATVPSVPSAADLAVQAEEAARELARRGQPGQRIPDAHTMPDTSINPTPKNSVTFGTLLIWNSDDGGPFITSRERVCVQTEDGKVIETPQAAVWTIFREMKRLSDLKKKGLVG